MPKRMNITKDQRIRIRGREYQFFNAVPPANGNSDTPHDLQFRDVGDHRIECFTHAEFDTLYSNGDLVWWNAWERPHDDAPCEPCATGEACTGCEQCRDRRRRSAQQRLMQVFDENPVSKTDRALQAFLDREAASWPADVGSIPKAATFRRMLREWGEAGDRRLKYIGDRRPRGVRKPRLDPLAEEVLWEKAEAFWTDRKVTCADVYAAVHVSLTAMNRDRAERGLSAIGIPGRVTVWRMLTRHSDYDNMRRRIGARLAQRTFKPLKGKLEARRILDVAIMDHTVLDCFVVDDEHNVPVGRPYLTFLIDVRSRYPLAYILGFTPPSVETAMACLRQAVRPKDTLNEKHPDVAKWEVFGVPRTVLVDNGWEFTGRSFKDACEDAGISIEWAPVRTPEYKGIVERAFSTFNKQLFHKLKGGVPLKPHKLAEYGIDPQAEAVLLLSEIDELIHQYVVEVYGRTFHTGIKAVPEQVWRERQAIDGIDYAPNLRALDLALSKLGGMRSLDRKGIDFNNLNYSSDAVFDLLNQLLPRVGNRGRGWGTVKVKFKYWPEDLSRIAVWNPVDAAYVELPCTSMRYAKGLSEHHHNILGTYARSVGLNFATEEERCAAKARLNDKIGSFVNDRLISTRRRTQRLKPRPIEQLRQDSLQSTSVDGTIAIETISTRRQGDHVFKSQPKYAKRRRAQPTPVSKASPAPSNDSRPGADIFAGFDRQAILQEARDGGAQ